MDLEHARLSQAVAFNTDPFVGLGDSQDAQQTLEFVKGSVALAIRTIRQRIVGLDLGVYLRRFVDGDFEDSPVFDHPLQRLIDNPTLAEDGTVTHSARQMWGSCVSNYLALGENYFYVIMNGTGIPTNLQIAQPGTIQPLSRQGRIVGYEQSGTSGTTRRLRPSDIVRTWTPDEFNPLESRGVLSRAATQANTDFFVNQTWEKFFRNDATPKLAFEAKDLESDLPVGEELVAVNTSWLRRLHRRLGGSQGVPAWVKPGWTVRELQSQMENAAGAEMMKHTRRTVLQAFGVPPSLTGDVVDVNRAAAETNRYVFDVNTIEPITKAIAESLTDQLATQYDMPAENVRLIVKYKPFIQRDKEFLLRQEGQDATTGIRSINRILTEREPSADPVTWGEQPRGTFGETPYTGEVEEELDLSNFTLNEPAEPTPVPVTAPEEGEVESEPEEERRRSTGVSRVADRVRAHFAPTLEWERILKREELWVPRFARRERSVLERQKQITIERFLRLARARAVNDVDLLELFPVEGWETMFARVIEPVRTAAFVASGDEAIKAITGESFIFTEAAKEQVRLQAAAHSTFINQTTQSNLADVLVKAIADGIGPEETASRIASTFNKRKTDARRIARTEMAAATQAAQEQGYIQSGVVERKMWNTSLDAKVRDSHTIEGQTVELEELFTLTDGDRGIGPGAVELDVSNRVNCRCFITPVFTDEDTADISFRPPGDLSADPEDF